MNLHIINSNLVVIMAAKGNRRKASVTETTGRDVGRGPTNETYRVCTDKSHMERAS